MTGGSILNRPPLVPSAADGRHIPERDEPQAEGITAEFEEDTLRRWISVAACGTLVLLAGVLIAQYLSRVSQPTGTLALILVGLGVAELLVGTFVAYLAYPAAIGWVALASIFPIAAGIIFADAGSGALNVTAWAGVVLGLGAAGVGIWRAIASWSRERREDLAPAAT